MGTDTTPSDPELPEPDDTARPRETSERLRKAVANDNTNGAPRPRQAPDPSPDAIVRPSLVPR